MNDLAEEKRRASAGRQFWQRPMYGFLVLTIIGFSAIATTFICGYRNCLPWLLISDGIVLFCAALCWTQYEGWNTQIRNITESQEKGGESL